MTPAEALTHCRKIVKAENIHIEPVLTRAQMTRPRGARGCGLSPAYVDQLGPDLPLILKRLAEQGMTHVCFEEAPHEQL